MKFSRARIKGLQYSIPAGFNYFIRSLNARTLDLSKLFQIVFLDETYRKYDFESELKSIRNGISTLNSKFIRPTFQTIEETCQLLNLKNGEESSIKLGSAFKMRGSDKSLKNNLHKLYGPMLDSLNFKKEITILEIGLGSNNLNVPSNMGIHGKPGASLFAFEEYLGNRARIIGADVDEKILFQTQNIETYFVDQLKIETLQNLADKSEGYDLVIDDGLHTYEANINTLSIFLSKLNSKGFLVIEDISSLPENLLLWHVLSNNLEKEGFRARLVKTETSLVFVVRRDF